MERGKSLPDFRAAVTVGSFDGLHRLQRKKLFWACIAVLASAIVLNLVLLFTGWIAIVKLP